MPASGDLITMLHAVLLIGFMGVTALLLLFALTDRLRARRILLAWRARRYLAFPAAPLAFNVAVLACGTGTYLVGPAIDSALLAGYLLGGSMWFLAGYFSATYIVTDYGMVTNDGRRSLAVGWAQVVDYFEVAGDGRHEYVFFFLDEAGLRRRLEVSVPAERQPAFQNIVDRKLDARFDLSYGDLVGKKALEK